MWSNHSSISSSASFSVSKFLRVLLGCWGSCGSRMAEWPSMWSRRSCWHISSWQMHAALPVNDIEGGG